MKDPFIVHRVLSRLHPNRSWTGLTTRGIPLARMDISHQRGRLAHRYINLANGIKSCPQASAHPNISSNKEIPKQQQQCVSPPYGIPPSMKCAQALNQHTQASHIRRLTDAALTMASYYINIYTQEDCNAYKSTQDLNPNRIPPCLTIDWAESFAVDVTSRGEYPLGCNNM